MAININRKVIGIVIFLMIIRVAMATALVYGFPQKSKYTGGYFYLSDEEEYFRLAFSLARLSPVDSYRTLGFPLLLLPFIWISKANSFEPFLLPVAIFHACILAPISIILILLIAKKLTKDSKIALLSATLWTFFPYLVYIFVHTKYPFYEDAPVMRMAHQMWLQAVSDPPSVFLILLAVYVFILSLEKKNMIYSFLAGISFGLATLVRPANIGLAVLFLSFYLFKRRSKHLISFIGSSLFMVIPQFIYNWHFYGSPFKFTTFFAIEKLYAEEFIPMVGHPLSPFSIGNFLFFLQQIRLRFPFALLLLVLVIFWVIVYTLFKLYRESPHPASILMLWILPYFFIYGCYSYFYKSVLHFLMPIIPALIIIISIALRRSLWSL